MRIAVGCDHRGFAAKRDLLPVLREMGCQIEDFGCDGTCGVDYPDIAYPLALAVASEQCELGILIDGNGMGMSMVANKVHGVRAAVVQDEFTAHCAREQHHCNVICLTADLIGGNRLRQLVEVFLMAPLSAGRHARRIEKLRQIEARLAAAPGQIRVAPLRQPPLRVSVSIDKRVGVTPPPTATSSCSIH